MQRILIIITFLCLGFQLKAQTCEIVSADVVCQEELISFDVTASTGIQSVKWELGDASTSIQKSLNHKYSTSGVKNIKVTLTLTGGATCVATKQIMVYKIPQFKVSLKPDNIYCLSQNRVCLVDSSIGGDAGINIKKRIILWDDGDQTTTNSPTVGSQVCHTYLNTGTFKITIELTNDKDCKVKKEYTITILPDAIPKFKLEGGQGCDSAEVLFYDETVKDSAQILSRVYDWGDGHKTATVNRTASHYYKNGGFYKVSLTLIQKNGCRTTRDTVIDVFIPEIKFNIKIDGYRKCYGKNYHFDQTDNLIGALYLWTVGSRGIEGKTFDYTPPLGKQLVSLAITYAGCTKIFRYDSIEVVGIVPVVKVLNNNQCENKDTVYFCEIDKRYGLKKVSFLWTFGDVLGSGCTTSIKNGINTKSNCNYATDSFAKHKYIEGKCVNWSLTIIDHEYGCNSGESGTINLEKPPDYGIKFTADRLCLGLKPEYKILFEHSLCASIEVQVNYDSACGRNNFITFSPAASYQQTCNPNGWVTVGFAFKFGDKKVYRTWCDTSDYYVDPSRECFDTVWFHNWYRLLPEPFPPFEAFGKCIPSTVKPILLDSTQDDIVFTTWNWDDLSKIDTLYSNPGDTVIPQAQHIYKKAGIYNIKFKIENVNRCYGLYSQNLLLGYKLNMRFDTIICPGMNVKFNDSIRYFMNNQEYWRNPDRKKKGKESFKWDFGDGRGFATDTIQPVVKFSKKGPVMIRLAAVDSSGCFDTLSKIVQIGGVYAGIKAMNKKLICDDIIQFFDSSYSDFKPPSDSIIRYSWDFGDFRNPSFLKDPYHFYSTYGKFTITHAIENTRGCKDTAYLTINIDGPKPQFDIISDTVGCVPFKAVFKNTSQKTKDYIWYFGDPLKSKLSTNKDTNVSFTYNKPGIYYIYLFGSDSVINPNAGNAIYYCKSTFPDTTQAKHAIRRIVVLPIPKVDFDVDPILCRNKPFAVRDRSDSIYKRYKWVIHRIDSVETVNRSATLKSRDTGNFVIKFTPFYTPTGPYQRQCYDTTSKPIRVTDIQASFDTIKDPFCPIYTFINTSTQYKSIKWDLGHSASGDKENIRYENQVTHNYVPDKGRFYPCLFVESIYGCRDTICTEFDVTFNIKAILPNVFTPDNQDDLNDSYDIDMENVDTYELSIFNRWGQKVYHSTKDGYRNDGINWNGRENSAGTKCPEGVYFYIFKYKFKCNDQKREASGTITLIRPKE